MFKNSKSLGFALVALIVIGGGFVFLSKDGVSPSSTPQTLEQMSPAAGSEDGGAVAEATDPAKEEQAAPAAADNSLLEAPAAMSDEVAAAMKDRVLGDPKAPVTIIEYASMTCSHCAHFATTILPEVKKRLIDTGKAKLIYRDFPFDKYAVKAAMMARCVDEDQYFNLVEVIFSNQERWAGATDPLDGLAQLGSLAGMDGEAFKSCTQNAALETAILEGVKSAQTRYGVNSTPTFIFNNGAEQFSGARSAEEFEKVVNQLK